jgi:hypothetical protein
MKFASLVLTGGNDAPPDPDIAAIHFQLLSGSHFTWLALLAVRPNSLSKQTQLSTKPKRCLQTNMSD